MADIHGLIKQSFAYKLIAQEKAEDKLSHAYLFVTPDTFSIREYLKIFALLIACKDKDICKECRTCNLILNQAHPDVIFYPKDGQDKILSDDVKDIISQCYVKPLEGDKKIFVISRLDLMDERTQNKLLKILEEPPKGVCFLLASATSSAVLATIRSRVKQIEILPFSEGQLESALIDECSDVEKLRQAISASDKTLGRVKQLYNSQSFFDNADLVRDIIFNMQSSKDVLEYSVKVGDKKDLDELVNAFELYFIDMLRYFEGGKELVKMQEWAEDFAQVKGFNSGAVISILECLEQAKKRIKFNANGTMLIEWLLFKILEGKYKWQKL